jgi:CRP-like cAMP-binding protein
MTDVTDAEIKKNLIKKQPCFNKLTDQEVAILADLLIEKHYSAGEQIVKQGQPVDSVFLIVSGIADVTHVTYKENTAETEHLAILGPEEAIGLSETGFYSLSGIRTANVHAKTDMVLLRLSVAAFHGFALAYSHVNEVMRQFSESIISTDPFD